MRNWTLFFATLLLAATASAQMPPAPKPGPEHKKLEYFAGNWNCTGDLKPGPMGPGGKMTMSEDTKWMDGGFFEVIRRWLLRQVTAGQAEPRRVDVVSGVRAEAELTLEQTGAT